MREDSSLGFVMMNRKECQRMSVARCSKYYHLSTKDPEIVSCGTRLMRYVNYHRAGSRCPWYRCLRDFLARALTRGNIASDGIARTPISTY